MSHHDVTLDDLWEGARGEERFERASVAHLPEPAQRYLTHAIAEGTPLARAVRLTMHGEIRLRDWVPFEAEQVIRWDRGMLWKARTKMAGMPVSGWDRFVDGEGAQRWKALGLFTVMKASGPDITRSAAGRVEAESIWLPSVLVDAPWHADDASHARATVRIAGDENELSFTIAGDGRLLDSSLARWGSLDGEPFAALPFGGIVEEERTFAGYTIPSRIRVGWHFGTDRFETDGVFFRGSLDEATFR